MLENLLNTIKSFYENLFDRTSKQLKLYIYFFRNTSTYSDIIYLILYGLLIKRYTKKYYKAISWEIYNRILFLPPSLLVTFKFVRILPVVFQYLLFFLQLCYFYTLYHIYLKKTYVKILFAWVRFVLLPFVFRLQVRTFALCILEIIYWLTISKILL